MDTLETVYILLRFPVLTETFITNEIQELQQRGVHVRICSLLPPKDEPVQHVSEQLSKDAQYAPALWSWQLWWAQLYFFLRSPIVYFALFFDLLRQPYPKNFWYLFSRRMIIFLKAVALAYMLKATPVQLLHTHFAWLSGAAAKVISKLLNIPFTVTVHAYDIYVLDDLLCLTVRSASRIIAISEYNKQTLLERYPDLRADLISVIHCGIDVDLFAPSDRGSSETSLAILSIGGLVEKKGHAYLIKACQQLKVQGMDFQCTIIGGGPNEAKLKQLVSDYDLEDRVTIAGPRRREEVLDAYRHTDLFVLASVVAQSGDQDGIPVVLMEAMAMQIPVISTLVSGIPELVHHGETGWLVPERDVASLVKAILHLAVDKSLRERLGCEGRNLVISEFSIPQSVNQLLEVFRNVSYPKG
ncbi:MAG: glycosyltransferase [Anaerolineae bacterium]|nr:glycosyltransferase [Anaerolineae bacterium]